MLTRRGRGAVALQLLVICVSAILQQPCSGSWVDFLPWAPLRARPSAPPAAAAAAAAAQSQSAGGAPAAAPAAAQGLAPSASADGGGWPALGTATDLASAPAPVPGAQLKLVQVVFRHGARTPTEATPPYYSELAAFTGCAFDYPGARLRLQDEETGGPPPPRADARADASPGDGSCRLGWLTPAGFRMSKELGRNLFRKYNGTGVVPATWQPQLLWARSTR
jgi:hypothetical protein